MQSSLSWVLRRLILRHSLGLVVGVILRLRSAKAHYCNVRLTVSRLPETTREDLFFMDRKEATFGRKAASGYRTKSLSWILRRKPAQTDSPVYFQEGPRELAQLALAYGSLTDFMAFLPLGCKSSRQRVTYMETLLSALQSLRRQLGDLYFHCSLTAQLSLGHCQA